MTKTFGLVVRVDAAAEILGVSPRTVRRWASIGKLRSVEKGVFATVEVQRLAEEIQQKRAARRRAS